MRRRRRRWRRRRRLDPLCHGKRVNVVTIVIVEVGRQRGVVGAESVSCKSSNLVVPNLGVLVVLIRVELEPLDFPRRSILPWSDGTGLRFRVYHCACTGGDVRIVAVNSIVCQGVRVPVQIEIKPVILHCGSEVFNINLVSWVVADYNHPVIFWDGSKRRLEPSKLHAAILLQDVGVKLARTFKLIVVVRRVLDRTGRVHSAAWIPTVRVAAAVL